MCGAGLWVGAAARAAMAAWRAASIAAAQTRLVPYCELAGCELVSLDVFAERNPPKLFSDAVALLLNYLAFRNNFVTEIFAKTHKNYLLDLPAP